MGIHIHGEFGDIAEFVMMPGDPIRAEHIAHKFFERYSQYSRVRNMLGFTGYYNGKKVSVHGSGMGQPSFSTYATELIKDFGVKKIIRVGTAGALKKDLPCGRIVIGMGGCTDSNMNNVRFPGRAFCPIADPDLFIRACKFAQKNGIFYEMGNFFSSDFFDNPTEEQKDYSLNAFKNCHNVLAVEMETAELYTLGSLHGVQTLSVCVISNNLITGQKMTAHEREVSFENSVRIALSLV